MPPQVPDLPPNSLPKSNNQNNNGIYLKKGLVCKDFFFIIFVVVAFLVVLAEPLTWVEDSNHRFVYLGNKRWSEITKQKIFIELSEESRNGSGLDLVVVLRRKRDGIYFRLAEGEAKSSDSLESIEDEGDVINGNWQRRVEKRKISIKALLFKLVIFNI